jgi:ABC-2 type transport system ATP-binding protein
MTPAALSSGAELAIRTEGLIKRFGGRTVVDQVNLRMPAGCTYGLIGVNGAGKSTTIRMIMGLLPPTSGEIQLRGIGLGRDRIRYLTGVGYVPDRPTVYGWMRVHQALSFTRRLQPGWNEELAGQLVRRFKLDPTQRVRDLSKGQAARLSLLLALAPRPEILILDEPMDGLDPVARDDFLEGVLGAACEEGRSVLISSHALHDVQRIADYIGLIHQGRLIAQCPTEELVQTTKRVRIVLEDDAKPGVAPPGTILTRVEGRAWSLTVRGFGPDTVERLRTGVPSRQVDVQDLSLDEIFKDFARGAEVSP